MYKYVFNCEGTEKKDMIEYPFDKLSSCMKLNTVKLKVSSSMYYLLYCVCKKWFVCAFNKFCILKICYTFQDISIHPGLNN